MKPSVEPADLHAARNRNGGPGQLQPLVRRLLALPWLIWNLGFNKFRQ